MLFAETTITTWPEAVAFVALMAMFSFVAWCIFRSES
jgi:hypothetical protein